VAVAGIFNDPAYVGGAAVDQLEYEFGRCHGGFAAACGSGTDALVLALWALGLGYGEEVIVPSMTFFATAEAVISAGCVPRIADVDPDTLLLGDEGVSEAKTQRTRAVIPVHLFGTPVSSLLIRKWCADGLFVIEDAAQAHLAFYEGGFVGAEGHVAAFSFYPGKNLGAIGDGGMVTSKNAKIVEEVRVLRDHGRRSKHVHERVGRCSRLDALQARVLSVKLGWLPYWNQLRTELAKFYRDELGGKLRTPRFVGWDRGTVHHLNVLRVPAGERAGFREYLRRAGINTGLHYPIPLSQQPALWDWVRPTPVAEAAAQEVVSLPSDPLLTEEEKTYIVNAAGAYWDRAGGV
jgi:dTDP-4-amino-4,6-dideoxygalactose transaminase